MLYGGFTRISYASIWSAEPPIIARVLCNCACTVIWVVGSVTSTSIWSVEVKNLDICLTRARRQV